MRIGTRGIRSPMGGGSNLLFGGAFIYFGAQHRIKEGEGKFMAYAKESFTWAPWLLMSAPAAFALTMLPAVPALTQSVIETQKARGAYLRSAETPFSSRFEHSDASNAAMQRGLAAIGDARSGLGTEAFALTRRYGR